MFCFVVFDCVSFWNFLILLLESLVKWVFVGVFGVGNLGLLDFFKLVNVCWVNVILKFEMIILDRKLLKLELKFFNFNFGRRVL